MGTSRKRKASPSGDLINRTQPKQAPLEPKIGKRPEIVMLISLRGSKNIPARVLLDSG
jgi:hypothetical protein